jgi:hypothetical protein
MARESTFPIGPFRHLVRDDAEMAIDDEVATARTFSGPFWKDELDTIRSIAALIDLRVSQLIAELADRVLAAGLDERREALPHRIEGLYQVAFDVSDEEARRLCRSLANMFCCLVPADDVLETLSDVSFSDMTDLLQVRELSARLAKRIESLIWWEAA